MTDKTTDNAGDSSVEPELLLDVMGQQCPLPVLRARKRLRNLEPGTRLRIFVTDPVSRVDMPHFCLESGHTLLETRDRGTWIEFLIERGAHITDTD